MSPLSTLRFIVHHPLNRGRPFRAIARWLGWQIQSRLKNEVVINWIGDTKLVVSNGMTGATGNIYCGLHEYVDMSFLLHFLRPGDLFVDVGSNIGSYTILASGVCGARSIAVEPDPHTICHLQVNISKNRLDSLVSLRQTAVGEGEGQILFTAGQDTMNRIATPNDRDVQTVPLTTLDALLANENPTFIKLDVEGHEATVIRGASKTLSKRSLKAVALETVDDDTFATLVHYGFQEAAYHPVERTLEYGRGASVNSLFVRDIQNIRQIVHTVKSLKWEGDQI